MSSCNSYIYQPFSLKSQLMCNKGCFFPWLIQLNRLYHCHFQKIKQKKKGLVCLLILLINDPLKRVSEKTQNKTTSSDLCQHSSGLIAKTKTTSSKWPSGQPSPDWLCVSPRLWKTTALNLLSRFQWVKLRQWWGLVLYRQNEVRLLGRSLMKTSKLTCWDNYEGRGASNALCTVLNHLTMLSAAAPQQNNCK